MKAKLWSPQQRDGILKLECGGGGLAGHEKDWTFFGCRRRQLAPTSRCRWVPSMAARVLKLEIISGKLEVVYSHSFWQEKRKIEYRGKYPGSNIGTYQTNGAATSKNSATPGTVWNR